MPATSADVARATREAVTDISSDAAVLTRQPGARDGLVSPRRGYFDSIADAATVNAAARALIGTERRRFAVRVGDVIEPTGSFNASQVTPTVTLVDADLAANGTFLVARIEIDDEAGVTAMELFG
jgi:hypothetical protein